MSDEPQDSTPPPPTTPERSKLQAGIDWVAKHWPRARLAHEVMMLDKIQRQNQIVETVARNAMRGQAGNTADRSDGRKGGKMGVSIGDRIIHHHYPQSAEPSSLALKAIPYLLAAALGAGAGATVPWLASVTKPSQVVPSPTVADTDTTRRIEFEVWRPEE